MVGSGREDRIWSLVWRAELWWERVLDGSASGKAARMLRWLRREGHGLQSVSVVLLFFGIAALFIGDAIINKLRLHEFGAAAFTSALAGALIVAGLRLLLGGREVEAAPPVRPVGWIHRAPRFSPRLVAELQAHSPTTAREFAIAGGVQITASADGASTSRIASADLTPIVVNPGAGNVLVFGDASLISAMEGCEAEAVRRQHNAVQLNDFLGWCSRVVDEDRSKAPPQLAPEPFPVLHRSTSLQVVAEGSALVETSASRLRFRRRPLLERCYAACWVIAGTSLLFAAVFRLVEVPVDYRGAKDLLAAERAFESGDLNRALSLFLAIQERHPASLRAALGMVCVASASNDLDLWIVTAQRAVSEGAAVSGLRCAPPGETRIVVVYSFGGAIVSAAAHLGETGPAIDRAPDVAVGDVAAAVACAEAAAHLERAFVLHAYVALESSRTIPSDAATRLASCEEAWGSFAQAGEVREWIGN